MQMEKTFEELARATRVPSIILCDRGLMDGQVLLGHPAAGCDCVCGSVTFRSQSGGRCWSGISSVWWRREISGTLRCSISQPLLRVPRCMPQSALIACLCHTELIIIAITITHYSVSSICNHHHLTVITIDPRTLLHPSPSPITFTHHHPPQTFYKEHDRRLDAAGLRIPSIEEAREFDTRCQAAWTGHPRFTVIVNRPNGFEGKLNDLVCGVAQHVGIQVPREKKFKKYLLSREPSIEDFPEDIPVEHFEVNDDGG